MPGPLVWILAAQTVAILYLFARLRRLRSSLVSLKVAHQLTGDLAMSAYAAAYAQAPQEEKQKLDPEWRAYVEQALAHYTAFGSSLMQIPPSAAVQAMVREATKSERR